MRYQLMIGVALLCMLSACNLSSSPPAEETLIPATSQATGRPSVSITSPAEGAEVTVNTPVLITAQAADSVGVTRIQLLANNQIVKTVSSESAAGQRNLEVLLDYTPRTAGTVALQVKAFRGAVESDPSTVNIIVRQTQAQVTATLGQQPNNVPTIDPNDSTCRARVDVSGLNLRSGPGTSYDRITVLGAGQIVPIVGRIGDNTWWQVRASSTFGWVSAELTSEYGICTNTPIVNPPPSPTVRAPTATVTPFPTIPTSTPVPAPTFTPTPGRPDLVISNISGPTSLTLGAGGTVTGRFAVNITNTGSARTGQFNSTITIQTGGSPTALGVVANLDAGESIVLSIDLAFNAPGTYTVQAQVDTDSTVTEISEVNNQAFASAVNVQ